MCIAHTLAYVRVGREERQPCTCTTMLLILIVHTILYMVRVTSGNIPSHYNTKIAAMKIHTVIPETLGLVQISTQILLKCIIIT